ncbi:MAG: metallophosphoesterase [Psittacicella sp.]
MKINLLISFFAVGLSISALLPAAQASNISSNYLSLNSFDSINFITLNDIHLNPYINRLMVIDPKGYNPENDMDRVTYSELQVLIKSNIGSNKLIQEPNFIIYLGDAVGHTYWYKEYLSKQNPSKPVDFNRDRFVRDASIGVYKGLLRTFPNTPIIVIFGNNDSFPRDYGIYDDDQLSSYNMAKKAGFKNGFLSTGVMCADNSFKGICVESQNPIYGYFTIKLRKNLELIGLNSVMFSPKHKVIRDQEKQIAYLKQNLQYAKAKNISVIIAMHIPVGNNVYKGKAFWNKTYQNKFIDLVRRYSTTIKGILVSHTHMEEFKKLLTPTGYIGEYFTAGLSTSHGNSPSIKQFDLVQNNNNWTIDNYITYQIHNKNNYLTISKYYNFGSTYCSKNTLNINNCLAGITFQKISPRYTVNNPNHLIAYVEAPQDILITKAN